MPTFVEAAAKSIFFSMQRLFKHDKVTHMASVELWVLITTLLLVVRFCIDFFGPWYSNRYTMATVQIIELLNYNMVHYTLGLMQLSAARVNDYFQVWGVLMVTLQYSVNVGRPYGRSKRIPLLDLMSSFWTGNLLRVQTVWLLKIPLWFIWSVNAARMMAYFLCSDKAVTRNEENARLVCDYMRYEHTLSKISNTESMSGYKYLVSGEDQQKMKREFGNKSFSLMLDVENENVITVEKVWGLTDSRLLGRTADPDNKLKDVCLSYALYKLLRRRFYDLPIHEADQEKTKKLVLEGILKDGSSNFKRAFRITGVELSFLQDLFHSKHAQMFHDGFPYVSMLLSLSLVAATGYIAYPVRHIPKRIDPKDLSGITHGVSITRFIVFLIILKEILEIVMYVFSQWTKVQMICMHISYPRLGRCCLVEKAMGVMFKLIRKGKWDQKIRQYNLLISSRTLKLSITRLFPTSIKLETEVMKAIFQSFKSPGIQERITQKCEGLQQNPEMSLSYVLDPFASNADHLEWAIHLEADTHRILVWHIATCLCEINLSDDATELKTFWLKPRPFVNKSRAPEDVWKHYITASSLSNYCAYLVTKGLVPDNGLVVRKVFFEVRSETHSATFVSRRFKSLSDIYNRLMMKSAERDTKMNVQSGDHEEEPHKVPEVQVAIGNDPTVSEEMPDREGVADDDTGDVIEINEEDPERGAEDYSANNNNEDTITLMGTRLGKQLMEMYATNRVSLWEGLAKFWAGFLLHLAAHTSATKHKGHLAGSGELITHLWALQSHAGFLGSSQGEQLLDPLDTAHQDAANRDMMTDPKQTQTFAN